MIPYGIVTTLFPPPLEKTSGSRLHSSARTRLRPGAAQILVMTRFHEDDLAARLLHFEDDWHVVHLPAEAEADDPLNRKPGEMLWDSDPQYPYGSVLREQKKSQLPSVWSSLFQGRPAPEQGDYFRAEWFRPMTALPARDQMNIFGASDYAVSAGKGDFTVHVIVGLDQDGTLYLLDFIARKPTPRRRWMHSSTWSSCGSRSASRKKQGKSTPRSDRSCASA